MIKYPDTAPLPPPASPPPPRHEHAWQRTKGGYNYEQGTIDPVELQCDCGAVKSVEIDGDSKVTIMFEPATQEDREELGALMKKPVFKSKPPLGWLQGVVAHAAEPQAAQPIAINVNWQQDFQGR